MSTTDHQHTPTDDQPRATDPIDQLTETSAVPAELGEPGGAEEELGLRYWDKPEQSWTAFDRSEAYLDSRPTGGVFDPAAEYGDPGWREPESDAEAAARTAHLASQLRDPQTAAWLERVAALSHPSLDTPEAQLREAEEELHRAGHFHDPDEIDEARAHRDQLAARLPTIQPITEDAEARQRTGEVERDQLGNDDPEDHEVHAGEFDEDQFDGDDPAQHGPEQDAPESDEAMQGEFDEDQFDGDDPGPREPEQNAPESHEAEATQQGEFDEDEL